MKTAQDFKNEAFEQLELRKVLLNHAHAYLKDDESVASTIEKVSNLNANADFPLEEDEIEEIVKEASNKRSSKSQKVENDKKNEVSFIENDYFIAEQAQSATDATHATRATHCEPIFIIYNKQTGEVKKDTHLISGDIDYTPVSDKTYQKGAVKLPTDAIEYGTTEDLLKEIEEFLYQYFEVPKIFEKFLPCLILFYWVYEKFPFIPYLHFVGLTGTGKTTAQEVLGSICYKPIDASGSLSLSPIFRISSKWGGTLLLDEFEPDGDSYKEMLNFLKGTVGDKVILKTEGEGKREVEVYTAKCPKIFTSENPINNAGLQSRTIVIKMEKNKKKLPLYRLNRFNQKAEEIRNKLLLWRFRHLNKINLEEIEYGYPELEGFDRRVQQVITPIYYFSDDLTRDTLAQFAKMQQEETHKERRESIDGQIFQAILDRYPEAITVNYISTVINGDKPTSRSLSEKKIISILRKVLQFETKRMGHENITTLIINGREDRIEELKMYYGLLEKSVASVASDANEDLDDTDEPESATHSEKDEDATDRNVSQLDLDN